MYYMCGRTCVIQVYGIQCVFQVWKYMHSSTHVIHIIHHTCIKGVTQLTLYITTYVSHMLDHKRNNVCTNMFVFKYLSEIIFLQKQELCYEIY